MTPTKAHSSVPLIKVNPSLRRYVNAFKSPRGLIGLILFAILALAALLASVFFPGGYDVQTSDSLQPPSLAHLFGTDELGRDVFTRTLYGLRTDLSIIVVAVPLGMVLGTALGLAGAFSKTAGVLIQRFLDIIVGFPGVLLGIIIILIIGPGWLALVLAVATSSLPTFGRLARAAWISQSQREYVVAARTLGVRESTVVVRHVLPNALDPIIVSGAVYVVYAIFIEAGLSIIGVGIQPPLPSLGSLLNVGMRYVYQAPTYVLGPTLVLVILALSFTLMSDSLNRKVNQK